MSRYTFTGANAHILSGLTFGSNVTVTRNGQPVNGEGTVVGQPGDVIDTTQPYVSSLLTEQVEQADPTPAAPDQTPQPDEAEQALAAAQKAADEAAAALAEAEKAAEAEHPTTSETAAPSTTSNGVSA